MGALGARSQLQLEQLEQGQEQGQGRQRPGQGGGQQEGQQQQEQQQQQAAALEGGPQGRGGVSSGLEGAAARRQALQQEVEQVGLAWGVRASLPPECNRNCPFKRVNMCA